MGDIISEQPDDWQTESRDSSGKIWRLGHHAIPLMSTIPVLYVCLHLFEVEGLTWREIDHTAMKIVQAVKGEPINGYFDLWFKGKKCRFDQSNVNILVTELISRMGSKLRHVMGERSISVIPIPNSNAAVGSKAEGRTDELAKLLVVGFGPGAVCEPLIRWKAARCPLHKGSGFRHPDLFQDQMVLLGRPQRSVVLFDDVMTTGCQLIAAARLLQEAGHTPIRALVVGRVTKTQQDRMIQWRSVDLNIGREALDLSDIGF